MTLEEILSDLKKKVYYPVYFLHGEEPYFIDVISDFIAGHVLGDGEKEFNQSVLYGKETDTLSLISYARRYPMMANHQVIIVKEAQDLKNTDHLVAYFENPTPSTILVFCYKHKKLDMRTKMAGILKKSKQVVLFESQKMYDNKIPGWITQSVAQTGRKINPKAAALMAEYLGNDLSRIHNELNKLSLNVEKGVEIGVQHIEQNIGISKDYNIFEFQAALGKKDVIKAHRIIHYFAADPRGNPLVVTLSSMYNYFSKLMIYHSLGDRSRNNVAAALGVAPFFVPEYEAAARMYPQQKLQRIISWIHDYDLKSKGVNNVSAKEGDLLKELVFKILH